MPGTSNGDSEKLRVWAVDDGKMTECRAGEVRLYRVPHHIAEIHRHALQVVVTGVAPKDKDVEWPKEPCDLVKKYVFGRYCRCNTSVGSAQREELWL